MAAFLLSEYHIPWLRLKIGKPGAIHNAVTVGVEIERGEIQHTQLCNEK
jgi:dihydroneopterin aldolase